MALRIVSLRNGAAILTASAVSFSGSTKTVTGAIWGDSAGVRRWVDDPLTPLPTELYSIEVATSAIDAIVTLIP